MKELLDREEKEGRAIEREMYRDLSEVELAEVETVHARTKTS